ncbi:MAG: M64 family metallopeptidase [Phycisphaerales bacterium]
MQSQTKKRPIIGFPASLMVSAACLGAPTAMHPDLVSRFGEEKADLVYCCIPDVNLLLHGGRHVLDVELATPERTPTVLGVSTPERGGAPSNRVDIVTVGDGYTAAELMTYRRNAGDAVEAFLGEPPFDIYRDYFNVHIVDVVSNESGVDNDPVQGVNRDTALDMAYWTSGIERLLGVSVGKAWAAASAAPDVDLILAVANSSKYGGAGYTSADIATVAGRNAFAADIAIHEFGHSLGDLADEYDYGGTTTWSGPEFPDRNVSILNASQMAAANAKWAAWLGENNPMWDGNHGTYEGATYHEFGAYRPTNNSMMRSLGRPFNHPSAEGLIIEIYSLVDAIDDASPATALSGSEVLFVTPMAPIGHSLSIQWFLDGDPIVGADDPTLDLSTLPLSGRHTIDVEVTDETPLVRDDAARDAVMTGRRQWSVAAPDCPGDATGDGEVDFDDLNAVLNAWGGDDEDADLTGDGAVNFDDLNLVLGLWAGC